MCTLIPDLPMSSVEIFRTENSLHNYTIWFPILLPNVYKAGLTNQFCLSFLQLICPKYMKKKRLKKFELAKAFGNFLLTSNEHLFLW